MRKKILAGIALLSMALIVALNVNAYDVIKEADNQDGGGGTKFDKWKCYPCPGGTFNWARCEEGGTDCDISLDQWPCY